ncbi:MAG: response regulator [bacterium]
MTERKRILVAEDDTELLNLLEMELSLWGYEVLTAVSGRKALLIAQNEKPDLMLLDVMLPEIDGYHVAQRISEQIGDTCPKILIMTGRDIEREKGIARMCGANSTIQKPFKMDDLHKEIARVLKDA